MTRRQSNNQWSGGIAAHPAPKNSECKNPLEKFSPRFFGMKTASSSLIIFQMVNYHRGVLLSSAGAIEGHFERKTPREFTKVVLFLHNAPAHRALATQKTLAYLGFHFLDHSHYSPDLTLVRLPPVPWTEKTIERSPFFVRRGGHCCFGDLV